MRRVLLALIVASIPAAAQAQAPAQPPATPSRVEVWVGGVRSGATVGGTVESKYNLPLVNGTGSSSTSQTLNLEADGAPGLEAGLQVFFTPNVGLQVGGSRSWSTLSGINGPYHLAIQYVSRQPPNYDPVTYDYARDVDWPDTEGTRTLTTIFAGPVLRWEHPTGAVGATLAGGLSLQRYGGAVQGLAYTEFRLGGHSTLFYSEHSVEIEPAQDWFVRPYLAGDLRVRFASRASLVGGVRVFLGSETVPIGTRVVRLVNPDEDTFPPELAALTAAFEPQATMVVPATRWRVFAGLVVEIAK